MKLMFRPDLPAGEAKSRHLHEVTVSLVVISDTDGIRVLMTPDGGLLTAPLLTTPDAAIRDIIRSCTSNARHEGLVADAIRQMESDLEILRKTERIFASSTEKVSARHKDKEGYAQDILDGKIRQIREKIRQLAAAEETNGDIAHLIPEPVRQAHALYAPPEGFPVILSEASRNYDSLQLVFAAGAACLKGREPRDGLACWRSYEPPGDRHNEHAVGKQVEDAVEAFISPLQNKKARIREGLQRAFSLNGDENFRIEATKRSIELLTGDAISSPGSLFRMLDLGELGEGRQAGQFRKPDETTKPPAVWEAREHIGLPVMGRLLIKYSAIPDLRVAVAKPLSGPHRPPVPAADDNPEAKRLFDLALTDPDARQVIDALISAEDREPAAVPGRNVMTLQWRKREREFFLRSYADCAQLEAALGPVRGEDAAYWDIALSVKRGEVIEESADEASQIRKRALKLTQQGFRLVDRPGACQVWTKPVNLSATSNEPLRTEIFIVTRTKPGAPMATREAALILHAIAEASRDSREPRGSTAW